MIVFNFIFNSPYTSQLFQNIQSWRDTPDSSWHIKTFKDYQGLQRLIKPRDIQNRNNIQDYSDFWNIQNPSRLDRFKSNQDIQNSLKR